jgi:molybdate transport system substrate-binding protein
VSFVVPRTRAWSIPTLAGLMVIAACSGCSNNALPNTVTSGASISNVEGTELVVFAASSLAAAFDEIGASFEHAHPGVIVTFNTGPSDGLARQIQSEGVADVFASASAAWMDEVQADRGITDRVNFVHNRLVLVTPLDNPARIESLGDLARDGVQLVLAGESVPVGSYAREVLDNARILDPALANVVSNETDAAAVVQKVDAGEADAGLVYESDISASAGNDLTAIKIPERFNVVATYPIAVIDGSDEADLAAEFIDAVTGRQGQSTLERYGFEPIDGTSASVSPSTAPSVSSSAAPSA